MFEVTVENKKNSNTQSVTCHASSCFVGKSKDALIRVKSWSVAPRHIFIEQTVAGVFVEDVSRGFGIHVNGDPADRYGPLTESDLVEFGPFALKLVRMVWEDDADIQVSEAGGPNAGDATAERDAPLSMYMTYAKATHTELMRQLDLGRVHLDEMGPDELRQFMSDLIDKALNNIDAGIPADVSRSKLRKIVLDESIGLGAIEDLLADPDVTEVMVNAHDDIYIEKEGKLTSTSVKFSSADAVMSTIERIISPLGRRIDESSPMVDARLRDGSRVNAVIPPLALRGPCITIRKFATKKLTVDDLKEYRAISDPIAEFLEASVLNRKNIVVSGGTGSGKTTLLNILSNFIPAYERVITVEDAAELKLVQPHVVSLEARPANLEGRGQVTIRDLVKNCLRMRPDRIVVGECRGGEALDMLQAMNTGHDGSLTTAHANSCRDMLRRLEVMVLMAGMDLPSLAIREQIASAVDIIVQQTRFPDGSRKITSVVEVSGMEGSTIQLAELFKFSQQGYDNEGRVKGEFTATGLVPAFYEDMEQRGIIVNKAIFQPNER